MPSFCVEGCGRNVPRGGNRCKECAKETGRPCDPLGKAKKYRARRREDPTYKEKQREYNAKYNPINHARRREDPTYKEKKRESNAKYRARRREDPFFKEKKREYNAKYNAKYKEKQRERNAKYNAKYNAERSERLREEGRQRMRKQGFREAVLDKTDTAEVVNRIAQDSNLVPAFHGQSLDEIMRERKHAIYIGETGRELHDEDLRFLTARGAMDGRGTNRPVLLWPDNKTTITMGQARTELGFQSAFVYQSSLKGNANMVEDGLQSRYHKTTVLPVRLWRRVGCGNHGFKQQSTDNERVHKVYVTFSKTALEKVAEGELFVDL
jgi:hypothetical protein